MARHESRARQGSTETPQDKSGSEKGASKSGTGTGSHHNSPPSGSAKRSSHGRMLEDFQKEESTNTTFWAIAIAVVGIFLFVYTRNDGPDVAAEGANTAAGEQLSVQAPTAEEHIKEEDEKPIEAQATGAIEAKREVLAEDEDLPDEIDKAAGKVLEKLDESENLADKPVSNEPTEPSTKQTAKPQPERTPQAESTASTKSRSQAQSAALQPEQAAPAEDTNTKASQPAKGTASSETSEKTKPVQKPAADVKSADIYNPY